VSVDDVDGTGLTQLIDDPAEDSDPTGPPEGNLIAFRSSRDSNDEISRMGADGTNPVRRGFAVIRR